MYNEYMYFLYTNIKVYLLYSTPFHISPCLSLSSSPSSFLYTDVSVATWEFLSSLLLNYDITPFSSAVFVYKSCTHQIASFINCEGLSPSKKKVCLSKHQIESLSILRLCIRPQGASWMLRREHNSVVVYAMP